MNNNKFSVVFDGQKVPDSELFGIKQRLKDVFNADRARIETLFAGKPVALKRDLSREDALKYQHMLKKMGIVVTLMQASGTASTEPPDAVQKEAEAPPLFSLAPLGSDLIANAGDKTQYRPSLFRTDHLHLAPQKGHILKADERQQTPVAEIKGEYNEWALSEAGEDLLKKSEKHIWQEAEFNTSELAFVESQEPLAPPSKITAKPINTEHLTLLSVEKDEK